MFYFKNKMAFISALLIGFMLMSGCAIHIIPTKFMSASKMKEDRSLVYGYFDVSEAPFKLKEAVLYKIEVKNGERKVDDTFDMRTSKDGMFYIENLKPGEYEFAYMVGVGGNDVYHWSLPDGVANKEFENTRIVIAKPGLYYLGTYKAYKMKDGGMFGTDRYNSRAVLVPNEKEILNNLLKHTDGTGWNKQIRKKLASMN